MPNISTADILLAGAAIVLFTLGKRIGQWPNAFLAKVVWIVCILAVSHDFDWTTEFGFRPEWRIFWQSVQPDAIFAAGVVVGVSCWLFPLPLRQLWLNQFGAIGKWPLLRLYMPNLQIVRVQERAELDAARQELEELGLHLLSQKKTLEEEEENLRAEQDIFACEKAQQEEDLRQAHAAFLMKKALAEEHLHREKEAFEREKAERDKRSSHDILGVKTDASETEIRKRYRFLAARYHPDKAGSATDEIRKLAEEEFKKIQNAFDTLMK